MTTRGQAISDAAARLAAAGVPDSDRDARLLYRWAASLSGAALSASMRDPAGEGELQRFETAITARITRKPVSQIIGKRAFWGREFIVTPDVLDPRPESECLISRALAQPAKRVLDLGTGSGCLLLTLLAEWPEATGLGVDLSAAALEVARENANRLDLTPRVTFAQGNWFDPVDATFDLIIANPPYLSAEDMEKISPELAHEPALALSPGGDGLESYRHIAAGVFKYLNPNGRVLFEIGASQGDAVAEILRIAGMPDVTVHPDLDGRDRVVEGFDATNS
ncbi:peptide chain release factor N(5)-glutamine methyltransferase [Rhodobacteraceae bacterium NNCM2]|nr:peptide chain release factor N(5)-glutamine methyltransferase [Coraliihabitans acroporae]